MRHTEASFEHSSSKSLSSRSPCLRRPASSRCPMLLHGWFVLPRGTTPRPMPPSETAFPWTLQPICRRCLICRTQRQPSSSAGRVAPTHDIVIREQSLGLPKPSASSGTSGSLHSARRHLADKTPRWNGCRSPTDFSATGPHSRWPRRIPEPASCRICCWGFSTGMWHNHVA